MISINHVSLGFGSRILFDDISFQIGPKDRLGLVGNNGAGKTTLLKVIQGLQSTDNGTIEKPSGITFGYLPQQMKIIDSRTLFNEVKTAFSEVLDLESKVFALNRRLEESSDYHSPEYLAIAGKMSEMSARIEALGASKIDEQIERTLFGLGFGQADLARNTSQFSGGWRMRIELAKILLKRPDLLLLDEPTNHLDIESILWVEGFLAGYRGAAIIISHDRAFLDNATNRTIEVMLGKIYDYKVPYSKYVILRNERRQQQLAAYKNQQKLIDDTDKFIERFRYKATKAVQVQSRVKQLEKIKRIEIDDEDNSAIKIRFKAAPRSGNIVIDATGLSKSYGQNSVLENISLVLRSGEKAAFVGKNGEGKTTLSRILAGNLEFTGNLKIGHNVRTGYFAQNQDETMDEDITVFETIDRAASADGSINTRAILGAFLFKSDDIDKKVKVLSGGERSRLALIKLLLEPFNFLILDEPTNHLDMRSKDILKHALLDYTGTLILVSHDREFLDGLVEKVYEFKEHKIIENVGTISDFLEKKKIDSLRLLEAKQQIDAKNKNPGTKGPINKETYLEKKEFQKMLRMITRKIVNCETSIEKLESELEQLSKQIEVQGQDGISYVAAGGNSIFERYGMRKKELDDNLLQWEKLHTELEELMKSQAE
jgi:ATP-binding cassette, subfamily F, member 3